MERTGIITYALLKTVCKQCMWKQAEETLLPKGRSVSHLLFAFSYGLLNGLNYGKVEDGWVGAKADSDCGKSEDACVSAGAKGGEGSKQFAQPWRGK